MFDFFIALFGGAYYALKLGGERADKRRADADYKRWYASRKEDMERWLEAVTDDRMEYFIDNCLKNSKYLDLYYGLHPVVLQPDFYLDIDDSKASIYSFIEKTPDTFIKRILMAQKGKIPRKDAEHGITTDLFRGVTPKDLAEADREHDFMVWYDKELKKHGIEETLLFKTVGDFVPHEKHRTQTADSMSNPRMRGTYYWWPAREGVPLYQ